MQTFFLARKYPSRDDTIKVCSALAAGAMGARELATITGISERKVHSVLAHLQALGTGEVASRHDAVTREYKERSLRETRKLEQMMHYAQSVACRSRMILEYFGEMVGEDCGGCDNCGAGVARGAPDGLSGQSPAQAPAARSELPIAPRARTRFMRGKKEARPQS